MSLSVAEQKVSQLILKGYSNEECAKKIGCDVKTIKFHLTSIYKKTGVKSRAEYLAMQLGYKTTERDMVMKTITTIDEEKKITQQDKIKFIDEQFKVGDAITQLHQMMKTVTENEISPATVNAACNCVARLNETINTAISAARFLNER